MTQGLLMWVGRGGIADPLVLVYFGGATDMLLLSSSASVLKMII